MAQDRPLADEDPQGGYAADDGDDASADDGSEAQDSDEDSEPVRLERPPEGKDSECDGDGDGGQETPLPAGALEKGGDDLSSDCYSDYNPDADDPQLGEAEPDDVEAYVKLAEGLAGIIKEHQALLQSRVKEVVRIRNYAKRSLKVLSKLSEVRRKHPETVDVSVGGLLS